MSGSRTENLWKPEIRIKKERTNFFTKCFSKVHFYAILYENYVIFLIHSLMGSPVNEWMGRK